MHDYDNSDNDAIVAKEMEFSSTDARKDDGYNGAGFVTLSNIPYNAVYKPMPN